MEDNGSGYELRVSMRVAGENVNVECIISILFSSIDVSVPQLFMYVWCLPSVG